MSKSAAAFGVYDATTRRFHHGTKADLKPGDLLRGGYSSNYTERKSPWIYFSEGDYLKKVLPRFDFTPGYRNGKPTATSYTLTWWFGRVVGW